MTSDLIYTIDQMNSNLFILPSLSEGPLGQLSLVQSGSHIVGIQTSFLFSFTIDNTIPANGFLRFYFPYNAVYLAQGTPSCVDLLHNNSLLSCSAVQNSSESTMGSSSVWYI